MVMVEDEGMRDRCLLLRRWGRRSEVMTFGSKRGQRDYWESLDGVSYDNSFIFDECAWNFEPNELCAAFGVAQLNRLDELLSRRSRNFELLRNHLLRHPDRFIPPRTTTGIETAWQTFCFLLQPSAGIRRGDLQQFLEGYGIATRTVWTGNATRQPMMRDAAFRQPTAGMPNADRVFEHGMLVPSGPSMTDDDIDFICTAMDSYWNLRAEP
jgi:CDP-6-deoxy-D-xylo-4-hexulose-3-dehydrase